MKTLLIKDLRNDLDILGEIEGFRSGIRIKFTAFYEILCEHNILTDHVGNLKILHYKLRVVIPYGNALVQKKLEAKDVRSSSLTDNNQKATV